MHEEILMTTPTQTHTQLEACHVFTVLNSRPSFHSNGKKEMMSLKATALLEQKPQLGLLVSGLD